MERFFDFLNKINLIDKELKLEFKEIRKTSIPDENIDSYYFKMTNLDTNEEMGFINIKNGITENILLYRGNIGYEVYKNFQGNNYSSRSCKILIPVMKYLGLKGVYITCNLNNISSKKNIEKIGAKYIDTVEVNELSKYWAFYLDDSRIKLRYILKIKE